MTPPLPTRVGRYEIVDRLGAGGMGVVYLATDPLLRRTVAIKVLPAHDEDLVERFAREARSAAALRHHNVVTIYDIGDDDGKPFIAMEYLDGESMSELVRRRAPLSIDRRLQLLAELCAGLGYAHRTGIVHRDIKPGNLMITGDGSLKILDFGLARITSEATTTGLTRAGSVLGSPHYMSPEQVEGKVADARSDIFSVGVVLYELLSYQKAYPGDSAHVVLHNIVHVTPKPIREWLPSIDAELEAIVNKGLEKDPEKRYQNLGALAADLARVRANMTAGSEFDTQITSPPAEPPAQSQARLDEGALQQRLDKARAFLSTGDLSQADALIEESLKLRADSPDALALKRELKEQRREREAAAARAKSAQAAVDRARQRLEEGAFEAALRSANEALAHDARNQDALRIRQQATEAVDEQRRQHERDTQAHELVEQARLLMAKDPAAAVAMLRSFGSPHPLVDQALSAMTKVAEVERQRHEVKKAPQHADDETRLLNDPVRRARDKVLARPDQGTVAGKAAGPTDQETVRMSAQAIAKMLAAAQVPPAKPPAANPPPLPRAVAPTPASPRPVVPSPVAPQPQDQLSAILQSVTNKVTTIMRSVEKRLAGIKLPGGITLPAGMKPIWLGVAVGVVLVILLSQFCSAR